MYISGLQMIDIQEMLGDAVNNLVKHFYKPERDVSLVHSFPSFNFLMHKVCILLAAWEHHVAAVWRVRSSLLPRARLPVRIQVLQVVRQTIRVGLHRFAP